MSTGVQNTMEKKILEVKNLKTYFFTGDGVVQAVDGISFTVDQGEIFGLVGESGCGKSVTSLSILRLVDSPGRIIDGQIIFDGIDLRQLSATDMVRIRGSRISMIFQQPQTSLNPVLTVGNQIAEVLEVHQKLPHAEAVSKSIELLRLVGIPDPKTRCHAYPHQMSGGQAQRVMIAMALALGPQLLIADEPTTALDVTIQAQILDLMRDLVSRLGTSVILITHDLGVIVEMADQVGVMYAGQIVEKTDVHELFKNPLHPYTKGLLGSIPVIGQDKEMLEDIPGSVPNPINLPQGCRFAPRCRWRMDICTEKDPPSIDFNHNHSVQCWLYDKNHSANQI